MGRNLVISSVVCRSQVPEVRVVLLKREKLVSADIKPISGRKRRGDNSLLWFDGKVHLIDRTEDFVDLANGSLFQYRQRD